MKTYKYISIHLLVNLFCLIITYLMFKYGYRSPDPEFRVFIGMSFIPILNVFLALSLIIALSIVAIFELCNLIGGLFL